MNKKNSLLFAILLSMGTSCLPFGQEASQGYQVNGNGYPAGQGYQPESHHHHHHQDGVRQKKLESLNAQLKDLTELQNSLINNNTITFPRILLAGSAVSGVVSAASLGNGSIGTCAGAAVACIVLGVMAKGSSDAEEQKRHQLSDQIQETTKAIAAV
jgi:hypothetical protein